MEIEINGRGSTIQAISSRSLSTTIDRSKPVTTRYFDQFPKDNSYFSFDSTHHTQTISFNVYNQTTLVFSLCEFLLSSTFANPTQIPTDVPKTVKLELYDDNNAKVSSITGNNTDCALIYNVGNWNSTQQSVKSYSLTMTASYVFTSAWRLLRACSVLQKAGLLAAFLGAY